MATFNMPGQQVKKQYIAGQNMYIGAVENRPNVLIRLHQLRTDIAQAQRQGHLSAQLAVEAEEQMDKAVQQAEQAQPNKQTLLDHINTAKNLLESVQAATGIVTGLATLAQAVQHIFD